MSGRRGWALAALFAGAALFSALTMLKGIQPNDEGLMLQAASRIAGGQVPYSDFWWFYPPGQPYLLAFFHWLFGPSLLWWRIMRVLVNAVVVMLAYLLEILPSYRDLGYSLTFLSSHRGLCSSFPWGLWVLGWPPSIVEICNN